MCMGLYLLVSVICKYWDGFSYLSFISCFPVVNSSGLKSCHMLMCVYMYGRVREVMCALCVPVYVCLIYVNLSSNCTIYIY